MVLVCAETSWCELTEYKTYGMGCTVLFQCGMLMNKLLCGAMAAMCNGERLLLLQFLCSSVLLALYDGRWVLLCVLEAGWRQCCCLVS